MIFSIPCNINKEPHLSKINLGYKDVVLEATEHIGELHDALKENGYTGHELGMHLVRLLLHSYAVRLLGGGDFPHSFVPDNKHLYNGFLLFNSHFKLFLIQ